MSTTKALLIAPGAGDPESADVYRQVYALIETIASAEGYTEINASVRWPGQCSSSLPGGLTINGAVLALGEQFKVYENRGSDFDVLARSFGCCVTLLAAEKFQPKRLGRIILWGPIPFWKVWQLFFENLSSSVIRGKDKGVQIDEHLYPSCVPVEVLLPRCQYPVRFAHGQRDDLVSPGFVRYLKYICKRAYNVSFSQAVPGVPHEVTAAFGFETQEQYRTALFG